MAWPMGAVPATGTIGRAESTILPRKPRRACGTHDAIPTAMQTRWWVSLVLVAPLGCGGSVSSDGGKGGTGAVGGTTNVGGTGNVGGTTNVGGTGNVGGNGGSCFDFGCNPGSFCCESAGNWECSPTPCPTPVCCANDSDCPELLGEDPVQVACVNGNCKMPAPPGQCWQDSDCPFNQCFGQSVCPCGQNAADCKADQPGYCASPSPPPACCNSDFECGDEVYAPCVQGVCENSVVGACWKDQECPKGAHCVGVSVCPCGVTCGVPDQPGKCQ